MRQNEAERRETDRALLAAGFAIISVELAIAVFFLREIAMSIAT